MWSNYTIRSVYLYQVVKKNQTIKQILKELENFYWSIFNKIIILFKPEIQVKSLFDNLRHNFYQKLSISVLKHDLLFAPKK